ncbi:MAG: hypothetical protein H0V44_15235 [Planctomycetes bacterium]|nr:hypothetical protein [Planctomycetota bacterium]
MRSAHAVPIAALALALSSTAAAEDALMAERMPDETDGVMAEHLPHVSGMPVCDVRLSAGVMQAPSVSERVSDSAGTATYDWKGTDDLGFTGALYFIGAPEWATTSGGSLLLGTGIAYENFDITPQRYETGGLSYANARTDIELDHQVWRVDLMIGYGSPMRYTDLGDLHVEVLLVGGGGLAYTRTQGFSSTSTPVRERGIGWTYVVGPRVGAYLCSSHWLCGVHADYLLSHAEVDVDLPNGAKSSLEIDGMGFVAAGDIGYRF